MPRKRRAPCGGLRARRQAAPSSRPKEKAKKKKTLVYNSENKKSIIKRVLNKK